MKATLMAPGAVRFERLLPGPVERVWSYLVESDKRAKWFCAGDFDLRVGGKVHLEFDNDRLSSDTERPDNHKNDGVGNFVGVITKLEPMRMLAHTWTWSSGDTEVTYELTPKGQHVLLTIVHESLGTRGAVVSVMSGWDAHTAILEDVLNKAEPRLFWKYFSSVEKEYEAAVEK